MTAEVTNAPDKRASFERSSNAERGKAELAKAISVFTFLAGLFGTYFQYMNAYQDQVREQAKSDLAAATTEFLEISNAYAEAQTLQQMIYSDFLDSISDKSDTAGRKLATRAGHETFQHYLKAKSTCSRTATFSRAKLKSISTGRATSNMIPPAQKPPMAIH